MVAPRVPRAPTVEAILDAFPGGVFGVRDAAMAGRVAGHGSGSSPPGLTQIDLGFEGVRVETARDRGLPTPLVVNELIFHWLVDAELRFPLTLRIDRYSHNIVIDTTQVSFDVYTLGGQVLAVAAFDDVCVTVRCSEEMLGTTELTRLDRSEVEQIVGRGDP